MLLHAGAHRLRACLRYVGGNPGASNRAIAANLRISHLGQTSALLARLHRAGLLLKRSGAPGRPNAWSLSTYGAEVLQALRASQARDGHFT